MTWWLCAAVSVASGVSCATLRSIAALRRVDFSIDGVTGARLAGVALDRVRDAGDLSAVDVARVGGALARGAVPFEFVVHVGALNPEDNGVAARLIGMDWTLLLDGRETVTGRLDREIVLEPGVRGDVPIAVSLDLVEFFGRNAADLLDLGLAVAGAGGEPKRIAVRAVPEISTALGPIRYPEPITIVSTEVGGSAGGEQPAGRRPGFSSSRRVAESTGGWR